MPAGVHDAGRDGAEALAGRKMHLIVRLQYAERVDIKSQRNGRPLAAVHSRDHAGEAAACGREKFRVRAVFLRPFVMRLQRIVGGKAHARVRLADGRADQHLIAEVRQLPRKQRSGPHLEPTRLGVAVQIPPDGRQLRQNRLRAGSDHIAHSGVPDQYAGKIVMTHTTLTMQRIRAGSQPILNIVFWS